MTSPLSDALQSLAAGRNLTAAESADAVAVIMAGEASEALTAGFLTALRLKGESADELAGAVVAVRARMSEWDRSGLPSPLLDTCGTGGDGANTVNISTATAVVVAACGVPVAKHGNRSASGNSGSAEVLSLLGVTIEAEPRILRQCLRNLGLTFLFAPAFHPALRFAGPVRRQLPFRTLFNLVGPLANPALPDYQLVGCASSAHATLIADVLARLAIRRAAVVTGSDGLDEVTLDGPTQVLWIEEGKVTSVVWKPDDFGLLRVTAADLRVSGPAESADRIRGVFSGEKGPAREAILANSAAALLVADRVRSLADGVNEASRAIDTGAAQSLLDRWAVLSRDHD